MASPASQDRPPAWLEAARWAAVFALVGPGLGALVPLSLMLFSPSGDWSEAAILAGVLMFLLTLMFAYVLGMIPAFATGLLMGLLAARLPNRGAKVAAAAAMGALLALGWALLISGGEAGWGLFLFAPAGALVRSPLRRNRDPAAGCENPRLRIRSGGLKGFSCPGSCGASASGWGA